MHANAVQDTFGDNNPLLPAAARPWLRLPTYPPRVTQSLLLIIAAVFALELLVGRGNTETERVLLDLGAKDNVRIIFYREYWRLITATFLHAGWAHIFFNGYALYVIGRQVEQFYGPWRFLAVYTVAGLAGSIASFAFSNEISVGASGAIFGVIGALGAFFWLHRRLLAAIARNQMLIALMIIVLTLVQGAVGAQAIDNSAHIGGLIGGTIAALLLAPRYRPGRMLGPNEQAMDDRLPAWAAWTVFLTLLAVEGFLFAYALAVQGHVIAAL